MYQDMKEFYKELFSTYTFILTSKMAHDIKKLTFSQTQISQIN